MAIEVALLRHVKMRDPWLAIENPQGLLKIAHRRFLIFAH